MNIANKNNVQLPRRLNIELGVWGRRKGVQNGKINVRSCYQSFRKSFETIEVNQ